MFIGNILISHIGVFLYSSCVYLLLIPPGTSADASADASADVSSDAAAEIYHRIKNAANTDIYSTMHLLLSL